MVGRLPYRVQIPLGLAVAVVVAALLVTVVSAQISARTARQETLKTVDRAIDLLSAQARPLLVADDAWRVFTLLRNTAVLLPDAEAGHARAAVLDGEGRVVAASEPATLGTGEPLLGSRSRGLALPPAPQVAHRRLLARPGGGLALIDPIRSEDGQTQGFVYVEVDEAVFAPRWAALGQPALIGALLAAVVLVPGGWWVGLRMTRPVARVAQVIERIGREDPNVLRAEVPRTRDPELGRISGAVDRLIGEMRVRQQAEQRALSAERMAAIGRLTAAVAHEINNPLGGLLNATQTLRLHGASDSTRAQTTDLIERGLQQIQATVAALVPQARIEQRPLEANDLADLVTLVLPVASRLSVELRANVDIKAPLLVPSTVMRQVMLNLLLNAVKAAGEVTGGKGWVNAILAADARAVHFTVSNSGERLTAEALERSVTAEGGNDPRGFGLWVCREVATEFGGGFSVAEATSEASVAGVAGEASAASAATRLDFWIPNRQRDETPAPG